MSCVFVVFASQHLALGLLDELSAAAQADVLDQRRGLVALGECRGLQLVVGELRQRPRDLQQQLARHQRRGNLDVGRDVLLAQLLNRGGAVLAPVGGEIGDQLLRNLFGASFPRPLGLGVGPPFCQGLSAEGCGAVSAGGSVAASVMRLL